MILYLDTSALIKLYAEEPETGEVRDAVSKARVVTTSEIGYVEARSALARKERDGTLSPQKHDDATEQLDSDFQEIYLLRIVSGGIIARAGDLTRQNSLRAYDAVHLATALGLREEASELLGEFQERQQPEQPKELYVRLMSYDPPLHKAAQGEDLAYDFSRFR